MHTDGKEVFTDWNPLAQHVGFKQTIHGGLTSTLLDELMVWACAIQTRKFAVCAELNVRFLKPIHPGSTVKARARLAENRRDRIYLTEGELSDEQGTLLASATGKYRPIPSAVAATMLTDIVGDLSPWVDLPKVTP
jgi:uncharacterized protein (TIGR00369 family)